MTITINEFNDNASSCLIIFDNKTRIYGKLFKQEILNKNKKDIESFVHSFRKDVFETDLLITRLWYHKASKELSNGNVEINNYRSFTINDSTDTLNCLLISIKKDKSLFSNTCVDTVLYHMNAINDLSGQSL